MDNVGKLGNVLALTHCTEAAAAGTGQREGDCTIVNFRLMCGFLCGPDSGTLLDYIMNAKVNE